MNEARKKQAKRKRIIEAKDERIEVISSKICKNKDEMDEGATLSVPFQIATKLNQDLSLRKSQTNLRKQLCVFIENKFDNFLSDYDNLKEPELRVRVFVEVMKMIIPRPKEYDDGTNNQENRDKLISRLFGK